MKKLKTGCLLTVESLQDLKDQGFRYVLVKGYSPNQRGEFIELNHFTLVPVMELPKDPEQMEIFAPIDSEILQEWVSYPGEGVKAYIERSAG